MGTMVNDGGPFSMKLRLCLSSFSCAWWCHGSSCSSVAAGFVDTNQAVCNTCCALVVLLDHSCHEN